MKVLVVEDTRMMALMIARNLEWLGYDHVTIAASAEEALEHLNRDAYGLLIVDWVLPGIDGPELVRKLRTTEKYRHTPILMATGNSAYENVVEARKAGADDYLVKPITYEALETKLESLLGYTIRPARIEDADAIVHLILELADYEKLAHEAEPDPEALRRHLAPEANPRCEALIAEHDATGDAVGFALFFPSYSTFLTGWGIYLEDLFVRPAFRRRGIGLALMQHVARLAVERGAQRLDWSVLYWNEAAIDFYRRLDAEPMSDWMTMRLAGDTLHALAAKPTTADD